MLSTHEHIIEVEGCLVEIFPPFKVRDAFSGKRTANLKSNASGVVECLILDSNVHGRRLTTPDSIVLPMCYTFRYTSGRALCVYAVTRIYCSHASQIH